ncbi:MAG: hypothetical protein DI539_20870 [Flavobacterium psychrophilum]|nr:MAG: hypothetical protein DI539_20870 [Flavobacterium psychrophilum]
MARIKLIDADNRLSIKYNKIDGIYANGDDNAYPQLIKSLVGASVTAKQCTDINSKYISGKGFKFTDSVTKKSSLIVNKDGMTINQLLRVVSKEFADQNNIWLHVNYNALYEIISVALLPSTDVRIGTSDSKGYSGKLAVYNNWDKSKSKTIKKSDFQLIDRFNPNPAIIEAQVEKAGGWNSYKGQILHVNADFTDTYSLSDGDCVIKDMNTENEVADIKNAVLRKGLFGSKVFITRPFEDAYARSAFEKTLKDLKGAENSSGILLLEASEATDDITKELSVQNVDTNIDIDMIEKTADRVRINIINAFGVPSILVNNNNDGSIFGQSGELIKQAKKMHWENKEEERAIIQEAFERIFSLWHEPINPSGDWSITPIINLKDEQTINDTGA